MTQPKPKIKFTVDDYMTTPDEKRYQLLDGELILAPSPIPKHQACILVIGMALLQFITTRELGKVWVAPLDVVLSRYDVFQPDILFVSNSRAGIITEANIQGAPDLLVEVLSPGTARYDRGYKRTLYGRHGVLEYWLVDPEAETVEVLTLEDNGLTPAATYCRGDTLASPLLAGQSIDLEPVFQK